VPRVYKYASEVSAIERSNDRRQDQDEKAAAALELGANNKLGLRRADSHTSRVRPQNLHVHYDISVLISKSKNVLVIFCRSAHLNLLLQESEQRAR
jgi:hypothetical protein